MDEATARKWLEHGEYMLGKQKPDFERREEYLDGKQDLPWAPEGIGAEHQSLRKQSIANWMPLAVYSPIQRLRVDGCRTGLGADADKLAWKNYWQANRQDATQTIVYEQMMNHGRGIKSVWPNEKNKAKPIVRPQSVGNVWLEPDPDDQFRVLYSVKVREVPADVPNGLILPEGTRKGSYRGTVYDDSTWFQFEKELGAGWTLKKSGSHPLDANPMVAFDYRPDANGTPRSATSMLIPQQDAINTVRFNMLLAMQYSAYRQRVVTGFDPVARDDSGQIIFKKGDDGNYLVDQYGRKLPVLNEFGRAAVDRILVFNGGDTKVFDMPESNLKNYVVMLQEFLTQFFATGQIPPQYLLSRMANLSGDAIAGAESTLTSLQNELKRYAGEGDEMVFRLCHRAAGLEDIDDEIEMLWADTEVKSFAQIVDGIQKLITVGFPRKSAWGMIPGATPPKVDGWVQEAEDEAADSLLSLVKLPAVNPPAGGGSDAVDTAAVGG